MTDLMITRISDNEWEELFSEKKNKKYWRSKATGKLTWIDPKTDVLSISMSYSSDSDKWDELFSVKQNKKYWKNKETGKSTWVEPSKQSATNTTGTVAAVIPNVAESEWEELFSVKQNKKYWKNKGTGKSTWVEPPKQSAANTTEIFAVTESEWDELFSVKQNKKYWKNKETGKSTWVEPLKQSAANTTETVATVIPNMAESEWEELFSVKQNKKYWKNKGTGKSTWVEPPNQSATNIIEIVAAVIPVNVTEWDELFSVKQNKKYWKNKVTGKSSWANPLKLNLCTAADVVVSDVIQKPALNASAGSPTQNSVRGVVWVNADLNDGALARSLLELRWEVCGGPLLEVLRVTSPQEEVCAANWIPISQRLVRLDDLLSTHCNQILGELRLSMAYTSEAEISASNNSEILLVLRFSDSHSAVCWYNLIMQYISGGTTTLSAFIAVSSTNVDMNILSGAHRCANESPDKLRAEANWVFGHELLTDLRERDGKNSEKISWGSPVAGLLVMRPIYSCESGSCAESEESKSGVGGGWTTCWVNIDRVDRRMAFHDHGPDSRAAFVVDSFNATLHLPDITKCVDGQLELHVFGLRSTCDMHPPDIAFKFQSVSELWRWSRAFAAVCGRFSSTIGETMSFIPPRVASGVRSQDDAKNVQQVAAHCAEVALAVMSACAERAMVFSSLRTLRVSGLQLRSARFVQVGDRVVLLLKGNNQHLTEGSLLVSVNGLSVATVSPDTMLKSVSDFPDQMTAHLDMWRFPRSEFHVQCLAVSGEVEEGDECANHLNGANSTSSTTSFHSSLQGLVGNSVAIEKLQAMFGINTNTNNSSINTGATPNKLEQVIMRKRLSILHSHADEAVVRPSEVIDVAYIKHQRQSLHVTTATDTVTTGISSVKMSDYYRGRSRSLPWTDCRLVIAGGAVAFLRRNCFESDGVSVVSRVQLMSCEIKLSSMNDSDDILLEIKDRSNNIVVRCPNWKIFVFLVESLLIATKLLNPHFTRLSALYDEVHSLRVLRGRLSSTVQRQNDPTSFYNEAMSPSHLELQCTRGMVSAVPTPMSSDDHSLLRAAETLELCLSDFQLPSVFPSASLVQIYVGDLCAANISIHRLMSEFLTTQYCVLHPLSSATDSYSQLPKTVLLTSSLHEEGETGGSEELSAESNVPLVSEIGSSDGVLTQQFSGGGGGGGNRRASTRMSLLSDSTALSSVPSSTSFGGGSSTSQDRFQAVLNLISSDDRRSLAVVMRHLRESAEDVMTLAHRALLAPEGDELEQFSHFVVHRLCNYISTHQTVLESILYKAAQQKASVSRTTLKIEYTDCRARNSTETKGVSRDSFSDGNAEEIVVVEEVLGSPSSFLGMLLRDLTRRVDVVAFVLGMYEDMNIDSLTINSGVADLCAQVVEPLCRRLEAAFTSGQAPAALRGALRVLSKPGVFGISASQLLSHCVVPQAANFILQKNRRGDELSWSVSMNADHINVLVDRVRDLLHSCFDDLSSKKLQLCLSDAAALSRSKWLIARCINSCVSENSDFLRSITTFSPIDKLVSAAPTTGGIVALNSMMCIRPSELIFVIRLLDLNNITSVPLIASSRDLPDALMHLQTSDLLGRLCRGVFSNSIHSNSNGGSTVPSGSLDREVTFILQIDKQSNYFSLETRPDDSHLSRDEHLIGLLGPLNSVTLTQNASDLASFVQGENELASIQWLVSAARSALKATYEQMELPMSSSSVRQLNELREHLQAKREVIAASLMGINRLELYKDLCSNFRAQQLLLLEQYRNRRRKQDASNSSQITSGLQQMLLSTGIISIAELSVSSGGTLSDDEFNMALSRMVASQLRIEGQIEARLSVCVSLQHDTVKSRRISTQRYLSSGAERSRLSALFERRARNSPKTVQRISPRDVDTRSQSGALHVGGPNPLWVVMQNVFIKHPLK